MNFSKPKKSGQICTLWYIILPNKGYSRQAIKLLVENANLSRSTTSNFLNYAVKHKYVIWDESANLYYRSDSILPAPLNVDLMKQRLENAVRQLDLEIQKQWDIAQKKQHIEAEEAEVANKISKLNEQLEPFRSR